MRKLLFAALLFLISSAAFAGSLTIVVGNDEYTRPQPATLEDAQTLLAGETALLNQVIASYISDSDNATNQVNKILTGLDATSVDLKKSGQDLNQVKKIPPAKSLAVGGFLAFDPSLSSSQFFFDAGPKLDFNLFNSVLLGAGVGFHVAPNVVTPTVSFDALWWVF